MSVRLGRLRLASASRSGHEIFVVVTAEDESRVQYPIQENPIATAHEAVETTAWANRIGSQAYSLTVAGLPQATMERYSGLLAGFGHCEQVKFKLESQNQL